MRGPRIFLIYWLPLIIWMVVIFSASTAAFSARHTSRIIGPILRWFKPDVTDETISRVQFIFRKGGHLSEYAVLGALFWNVWRKPVRSDPRSWRWSEAAIALAFSALYAISDEIHQAFVPGRQAQVSDVLIDTAGAAIGLVLLWMFGRRNKLW
ncbi:MAG TPA: VanZ family protein [Verrucomicrobiae bacterium]|nr:VanZ family protein [Verrucomicrobiae bacterium]